MNNLRGSYEKVPAVVAEWLAISARVRRRWTSARGGRRRVHVAGPRTAHPSRHYDDVRSTTDDVEAGRATASGRYPGSVRTPSTGTTNASNAASAGNITPDEPATSFRPTPAPRAVHPRAGQVAALVSQARGGDTGPARGTRGAVGITALFSPSRLLFGSSPRGITCSARARPGVGGDVPRRVGRRGGRRRAGGDRAGRPGDWPGTGRAAYTGSSRRRRSSRRSRPRRRQREAAGTVGRDVGCVDARRGECEDRACDGECESNPVHARTVPVRVRTREAEQSPPGPGSQRAFETDASRGVALGLAGWTSRRGSAGPRGPRAARPGGRPRGGGGGSRGGGGKCAPGVRACPNDVPFPSSRTGVRARAGYPGGAGEGGRAFEDGRTEGAARWARARWGTCRAGRTCWSPRGPRRVGRSFTAFGKVASESDMAAIDDLLDLPTTPFVHRSTRRRWRCFTKVRFTWRAPRTCDCRVRSSFIRIHFLAS